MGSLLDTAKLIASRQSASVSEHELNEINEVSPSKARSPRQIYTERLAWWKRAGYDDATARCLAWSGVASEWYRLHGQRTPPDVCAGCGEVLGASATLFLLPHGEQAHVDSEYQCIIAYGWRWKSAAAEALAAFGVPYPSTLDPDNPAHPAERRSTACREHGKR